MKTGLILTAGAVMALCSCAKETLENTQKTDGNLVYREFGVADLSSKTSLGEDGTSVLWTEGDIINIFDETASCLGYSPFTASGGGEKTVFSGMADASAEDFYALYPYNADAVWNYSDKKITTYLEHKQNGVPGNIESLRNISVAKASGDLLAFHHVTALLSFEITSSDVTAVVIKANGAEKLAGSVTVTLDGNGYPAVDESALGTSWSKVQMLPAEGGTFTPGKYYFVLLPCTLENGLTVNVTKTDGRIYSKASKKELALVSGKITQLGSADSGLSYDRDVFNADFAGDGSATMLYTMAQFQAIKAAYNTGTAKSLVEAVNYIKTRGSDYNYDPEAVPDGTKATTDVGVLYDQAVNPALLTLNMVMHGNLGNSKDRQKAYPKIMQIINDWAVACDGVEYSVGTEAGANVGSNIARAFYPYFVCFELLRGNEAYSTPEYDAAIESWFRHLAETIKASLNAWNDNDYFGKQYYGSSAIGHSWGLMSIGYALKDADLVNFAVDCIDNPRDFYDCLQGCILMEGDKLCERDNASLPAQDGEIYDRYRHATGPNKGLQSTSLTLQILSCMARTLENNGLNVYGYTAPTGENLLYPYKFYADFYATCYTVPDTGLKGGYYSGEESRIGKAGDMCGLFELGYNAYPESQAILSVLENMPNRANNAKDDRQMHDQLGYTRLLSIDADSVN